MLKRCFHNHQVVNAHTNEVEQTTHYYPYGGIIGNLSSNQEAQKYKYSEKALAAIEKIDKFRREREALAEGQDRTYGLDLYDFHARLFNPALPVFDKPDPLAEFYRGIRVKSGLYASARDIGNICAGAIARKYGLSWEMARLGFDGYQNRSLINYYNVSNDLIVNSVFSLAFFLKMSQMHPEVVSTQNAEKYGYMHYKTFVK